MLERGCVGRNARLDGTRRRGARLAGMGVLPRSVANVTREGRSIVVDGVRLDQDWLRDNCRCDQCRIVQTDERRWQPWSRTTPAEAASVAVEQGELVVVWDDGHRSSFADADWDTIERAMNRGRFEPRVWRAEDQLERFDHDSVVGNLDARRALFEAFRRDGAVVITGSPTEPGSIIDTARSLGITLIDSSLGFLFDVKLDPSGYNIAFTSEGLPPHNDNAQYSEPPSGQILAFIANEATGGDSVVVDGWAVLDELAERDPAAIEVLSRVPVGHRQYSTEADGFSRNPLIKLDPAGGYRHLRFSNQLRQPLPHDHPDLAEWYRAYRVLGSIVTDPALALTFRMEAGDSLLVNGYRVLHARTAFVADGARHLQDVYFNADDIHNALDRLEGMTANTMGRGH